MLLLLIQIFTVSSTTAQYRINKKIYDRHDYIYQQGDPYKPESAALLSLIIPGLGQATCGEIARGSIFFGSSIAWFAFISYYGTNFGPESKEAYDLIAYYFLGQATISVISMIDASRVAKINNLAWRDHNRSVLNLQLQSGFSQLKINKSSKVIPMISLRVAFQ